MFEVRDEETIIAQCTPQGSGAIALLRMSGKKAILVADKMTKISGKKKLVEQKSHTIHYGQITDTKGKIIDHVLLLLMHAPRTFTGQHTVEITCHNNPFIIEAIIQLAIQNGARLAQPGEFTKRAFLNKKIDLTQAEAINELIHAHTQQALQKSLAQLKGSFSQWLKKIEEQLIQTLMLCEASFEFIEDDVNFDTQVKAIIKEIIDNITQLEQHHNQQQQIKDGIRIALIGTVNAGKSSLFNKLIKRNRAIVTEVAGTTRDIIEAGIYRNQSYFTFVDTAGLRETEEQIEKEGIRRSFIEAEKADIILLLIDSSQQLSKKERELYQKISNQYSSKIISIASKIDQKKYDCPLPNTINISIITGEGISELECKINKKTAAILESCSAPYLLNKRQFHLLKQIKTSLKTINQMTQETIEYELIAIHIKDALERLTELSGKSITDRSIDEIFKSFCVGK